MPKAWFRINRNERGFSVVEVLLAATLFGFLVTALIGAFVYGRNATQDSGNRAAAILLADEGIQAMRNIRNGAYGNLTNGTFGLAQSGGVWALSGTSDSSGIYTRQITVADDSANSKNITSTVSWPQAGTTESVSISTVLSNWMASIKSWVNGILAGSADSSGTTNAVKVATSGNYAYTVKSTTSSNFVITNMSNPAAPSIIRTLTVSGTPTNIAILGNYAYVTTNNTAGEVAIVNITNPSTASVGTPYNAPGTAGGLGIYASGNYLYVGRAYSLTDNEFLVLNASNPTTLTLSGSFTGVAAMNEVYVSGGYAYVAVSSLTTPMAVINVSNPSTPSLAGSFGLAVLANALTVDGDGGYVYLGIGSTPYILNVNNPAAPTSVRQVTAAGVINDISDDGVTRNVFLGTSSTTGEFQVVRASDVATASVIRTVDVPGTASTIGGVSYNTNLDAVAAASYSDTQEVVVFTKN